MLLGEGGCRKAASPGLQLRESAPSNGEDVEITVSTAGSSSNYIKQARPVLGPRPWFPLFLERINSLNLHSCFILLLILSSILYASLVTRKFPVHLRFPMSR